MNPPLYPLLFFIYFFFVIVIEKILKIFSKRFAFRVIPIRWCTIFNFEIVFVRFQKSLPETFFEILCRIFTRTYIYLYIYIYTLKYIYIAPCTKYFDRGWLKKDFRKRNRLFSSVYVLAGRKLRFTEKRFFYFFFTLFSAEKNIRSTGNHPGHELKLTYGKQFFCFLRIKKKKKTSKRRRIYLAKKKKIVRTAAAIYSDPNLKFWSQNIDFGTRLEIEIDEIRLLGLTYIDKM